MLELVELSSYGHHLVIFHSFCAYAACYLLSVTLFGILRNPINMVPQMCYCAEQSSELIGLHIKTDERRFVKQRIHS